jgi:hypothetical protein
MNYYVRGAMIMRRLGQILSVALIGILPAGVGITQKAAEATSGTCAITVEGLWLDSFPVRASTDGVCGQADVTLIVNNRDGEVLLSETQAPSSLFGFYEVDTPAGMTMALEEWIGFNTSSTTTGTLPDWIEGEAAPVTSEFPFYVDERVNHRVYTSIRSQDMPMICFVQGMESSRCLASDPEMLMLKLIGVQSFPG